MKIFLITVAVITIVILLLRFSIISMDTFWTILKAIGITALILIGCVLVGYVLAILAVPLIIIYCMFSGPNL